MLPEPLPAAAPRSRAGGRAARAHPRVQPWLLRSERGDASSDTLEVSGGSGLGGGRARAVRILRSGYRNSSAGAEPPAHRAPPHAAAAAGRWRAAVSACCSSLTWGS